MIAGIHQIPKWLWFAVYVSGTSVILYMLYRNWGYDDPFITYRYAQNLRQGVGFVYNPGERILSTTSPLFAVLLAVLSYCWNNIPQLATLVGSLSLALGGFFLYQLARAWDLTIVGWIGLFFYPTFPLLLTTLGSETALYLALCLGAFAFYAQHRYHWTSIFVALAVLTRPDAGIILLILIADYLIFVHRPIARSVIFLFIAIILPWIVFAFLYFGSPIPVTLLAKQHQGSMAISEKFAPAFLTLIRRYGYVTNWRYWVEAFFVLLGMVALIDKRARRCTIIILWTVLYFISFSILGVSGYFWYYVPLIPGFIIAMGLGVTWVQQMTQKYKTIGKLVFYSIASILLVLFVSQSIDAIGLSQHFDPRLPIYQAVGEWLRSNTAESSKVGTLEVGIIGFYSQRTMIDFAGLIEPAVTEQLTSSTTYEDAALWATENYQPDYLVLHRNSLPRLEIYAAQHCFDVKTFDAKSFGYSTDLLIYHCDETDIHSDSRQ